MREKIEAARTMAAPPVTRGRLLKVLERKSKVKDDCRPLLTYFPADPLQKRLKKKPKKVNEGLRNDWNAKSTSHDDEDRLPTESPPSHRRSVSAGSAMLISGLHGDVLQVLVERDQKCTKWEVWVVMLVSCWSAVDSQKVEGVTAIWNEEYTGES